MDCHDSLKGSSSNLIPTTTTLPGSINSNMTLLPASSTAPAAEISTRPRATLTESFDRHRIGSANIPDPCYLSTPHCRNMVEQPSAGLLRLQLNAALARGAAQEDLARDPLTAHLLHGLAYTVGSALGCTPPSYADCSSSFSKPNSTGLTTGARAWTKHAHRSGSPNEVDSGSWWGSPRGPVATLNTHALGLFDKVMSSATWKNLHWLPHEVLVYEIRVPEGYGMRWSCSLSGLASETNLHDDASLRPWSFRGFVEPMMVNGHEAGWRH